MNLRHSNPLNGLWNKNEQEVLHFMYSFKHVKLILFLKIRFYWGWGDNFTGGMSYSALISTRANSDNAQKEIRIFFLWIDV